MLLRLQIETAINDLKNQAKSRGCKIAQRRRSGYLHAVDAARNSVLPYCALCWRLRSRSHYYSEKHHPIKSTKLYKQPKYAAITALKRLPNQNNTVYEKYLVQPNKQKNLGRQLYDLVSGYAPHPRVFLRHCIDSAKAGDWLSLSKNIVQTCKVHYPASYKNKSDQVR